MIWGRCRTHCQHPNSRGESSYSRHCQHMRWAVLQEHTAAWRSGPARYLQGWSPKGSSLLLPTPHGTSLSDLEWTGPRRGLPQRQPKSQVAPHPPQFLQPQCPDPQLQPTPHHSLALDLGQSQQRKGCGLGLLLRGTMVALKFTETARTSLASATTFFGAGHTLKGNKA